MKSASRFWIFRLVTAVAVPALLIVAVEVGLRLAGAGYESGFTVPCTAAGRPARCDNDRFTWQFFPPGAAPRPSLFAIPAEKKPGTFRIFIVGESAAQGDPDPSFGFARFLEVMLRSRYPTVSFEVINTAITAVNSHVLFPAVRDLARRQGDLFVLYIGNNEVIGYAGTGVPVTPRGTSLALIRAGIFVKSTRIGQLLGRLLHARGKESAPVEWQGMEQFLEKQVRADDEGLARVHDHFRDNLRDIVETAQTSGARVVVSTVGTNLKDSAPFGALHRRDLAPGDEARWAERVREGRELEEAGRCAEALKHYSAAAGIDDRHAELQFRIARCNLRLGNVAAARDGFALARDLDVLRFRADGAMNDIIRSVALAAGPGVQLVDGEAVLATGSADGIPGREVFYEHVHLTPRGNYLLARALYPSVTATLPEAVRRTATAPDPPSEEECDRLLALTGFDRARIAKGMLERLGRAPFTNQLDHDTQVDATRRELDLNAQDPRQAVGAYRQAISMAPADRWLRFNYGVVLQEFDPAAAVDQFRAVLEILPGYYPARGYLATALVKLGRYPEGVDQCRRLLEQMPNHYPALFTMAYALARQGRLDEAVVAYERALSVAPSQAFEIYNEIGRIRLRQEQFAAAVASFQKAAAAGTQPADVADALYNLAQALPKAGRAAEAMAALDQAIASYQAALSGNPQSAGAHFGLASALATKGDLPGAIDHYRSATRSDPRDREAQLALVRALEVQGRVAEATEAARAAERAMQAAGLPREAAEFRQQEERLESGAR